MQFNLMMWRVTASKEMSDEQSTSSAFALLLPLDVKFGNSFQKGKDTVRFLRIRSTGVEAVNIK